MAEHVLLMSWWAKVDPGADPAIVEAATSPGDGYDGPFGTFTEANGFLIRVEANTKAWQVREAGRSDS